jgi:arabinogalactan oligomer / maltooligosaccharide transport system permease protein
MTQHEGGAPTRALPSVRLTPGFWVKLALLALLDALVIWAIPTMVAEDLWPLLVLMVLGAIFINWAYVSPRARAMKWLAPGLWLMGTFTVFPILYTVYVSLTNWQTGNYLNKSQAIERIEAIPATGEVGAVPATLSVYEDADGNIRFWAETEEGEVFFGEPRPRDAEPSDAPLEDPAQYGVDATQGPPEQVGPYTLIPPLELFPRAQELQALVLDVPDRGVVEAVTVSSARLVTATQRYTYDAENDVLIDNATGATCPPEEGNFVCDGQPVEPGWHEFIGFANFQTAVTDPRFRAPLVQVFIWTVVFATLTVTFSLALGMLLAIALNDSRLRGKRLYRSLLILPYAMPGFISVIVWRGLFNPRFGKVSELLDPILGVFGASSPPWLADPFWAKVAVLVVSTWLTFPYMFLITTGALTAIPTDLLEAARVDGARAWTVFRRVTFPLLMVGIAPLLIGSFAVNFNNFVLIYLLTDGGPPIAGAAVPVGHTDILVTFTYGLAISQGAGQQFGLAAALTVVIFLIVMLIAAFSFRYTRRLEQVYGA